MGNLSAPSSSTVASGTVGLAAAYVVKWLVETFLHVPMDENTTLALGAVVSTVVGYFFAGGKDAHVNPPA